MANRTVSLADPYALTAAHIECMRRRYHTRSPQHFLSAFFLSCLVVPCHEIVHCVQHLAKQVDGTPGISWSAEHDASVVSLSLFRAVARLDSMRDIFQVPGLAEQAIADCFVRSSLAVAQWSEDDALHYAAWRDSFGLRAPPFSVNRNPDRVSEFKGAVACEGYVEEEALTAEELRLLFADRHHCKVLERPAPRPSPALAAALAHARASLTGQQRKGAAAATSASL